MGFNIVGVGPGDRELITVKAVRLINEADVIITPVKREGSKESTALSIAEPYIEDFSKVRYYHFPMVKNFLNNENVKDLFKVHGESINEMLSQELDVVFITLGDPSVYSTFTHIAPYVNQIEYVPGIASFLNGAALSKIPLCIAEESLCILNMTDKEENIRSAFKLHKNIVVMKVCSNQKLLKELLIDTGRSFHFMSNIGLENEAESRDLKVLDEKMPYFTIGIIK